MTRSIFKVSRHQARTAGAEGGGAAGQQELSQQQKEIISATYKLIRDKDIMDPKEYRDNLKSLSLIESKLRRRRENWSIAWSVAARSMSARIGSNSANT